MKLKRKPNKQDSESSSVLCELTDTIAENDYGFNDEQNQRLAEIDNLIDFIENNADEQFSSMMDSGFAWERSDQIAVSLYTLYDQYVSATDPDEVKKYARQLKETLSEVDLDWNDFMGMMASQIK